MKYSQVTTGRTLIDIYLHPRCPQIGATADGKVYTLWTKGVGSRRPTLGASWRELTTYCGAKFRPKQSIALPSNVVKYCPNPNHIRVVAGRFNLECFLGRILEDWEVCRHGSGGNCDHSKGNLSVGCQLNNIIDEVEIGAIKTNKEQLSLAIDRLLTLYNDSPTN